MKANNLRIKSFLKKYRDILLITLLKSADRFGQNIFLKSRYDTVIEMGVHKGEISEISHLQNITYIGYEANVYNIQKYQLNKYNVQNLAVVPTSYDQQSIELNIPIRNKKSDFSSGKSSVLKRDLTGWYDNKIVVVPTIKVENMPYLTDELRRIGVWIDIEGLSTRISDEISKYQTVKFIYFEFDMNSNGYNAEIFDDLENISRSFYLLKLRTSHDQFNYYASREKIRLYMCLKLLMGFHSLLIDIILLPSKLKRSK